MKMTKCDRCGRVFSSVYAITADISDKYGVKSASYDLCKACHYELKEFMNSMEGNRFWILCPDETFRVWECPVCHHKDIGWELRKEGQEYDMHYKFCPDCGARLYSPIEKEEP